MNDETVRNILKVIKKSNDKNVVVRALVKLRTDVVKDREGIIIFRDAGGISPMIRLLNRPHERILEVVLSILGNCCTDSECCSQVFELKIIPPLLTILKSVPNPAIQSRACRLLGNLAKENRSQLLNHNSVIAQSLCLILEESVEPQTTLMATRAVKFIVVDKQFIKFFVEYDGYKILMKILVKVMKNKENSDTTEEPEEINPQPVGLKVNQDREKYFEEVARNLEGVRSDIFDNEILKYEKTQTGFIMPQDKMNLDLALEIMKCVQIISEFQSQGSAMGLYCMDEGLSCIVCCAHDSNPFRSIALKIISNFSKNPFAISALSSADAVIAACRLLTSAVLTTELSQLEIKCCIHAVCMLSSDACNRAKIRRSGALKKLIEIAKISNSYTEISMILFALINFQYDNISMDLMLREGLVEILIKELNSYLNGDDEHRQKKCEEKKRTSRKRKLESERPTAKNPKIWDDIYDEESPVGSPGYLSPASPCSSRSMSPTNNCSKIGIENDCDSETYSPVCSEDEAESSEENEKPPQIEDFDVMKLLDIAFKSETNIEDNMLEKEDEEDISHDISSLKMPGRGNVERSGIDVIDKLLFKVTILIGNRGELGKPETLSTIVKAINVFGISNNTFGSSLTNILSESKFFATLLKQDVIHQLYKMTRIEELYSCATNFLDTLTCVAESGYGRGEVLRLIKNDNTAQKRIVIAIAFIIKTPKLLYSLLTEHGALYILINTILNKDDECGIEAADGLTSLAQNLGICLPICDKAKLQALSEFDESNNASTGVGTCLSDNCGESEMKFIIHRGCSKIPIKFSKKLLSENSEVFNSMLNSDFRESNEGEVHLKNYTINGIKYFLNLIHLKSSQSLPNIPPIYHFDSILEAYELSKMYIITEVEKVLYSMLIYRLNAKTCLKVFEWSLKNFNPELSEIAINYYLCSELEGSEKVELFREADYSPNSKEWNQMITDAILVKCQNLCSDSIQ